MADVLSVRLNDSSNPQRLESFLRALKVGGATKSNVVRHLVDAYSQFVIANGRLPNLPCRIVEIDPPEIT